MEDQESSDHIHDLDATIRVGKGGIEAVTQELESQLKHRSHVKVRFLRSARGESDTENLAIRLADETESELLDVRGHTAVFHR